MFPVYDLCANRNSVLWVVIKAARYCHPCSQNLTCFLRRGGTEAVLWTTPYEWTGYNELGFSNPCIILRQHATIGQSQHTTPPDWLVLHAKRHITPWLIVMSSPVVTSKYFRDFFEDWNFWASYLWYFTRPSAAGSQTANSPVQERKQNVIHNSSVNITLIVAEHQSFVATKQGHEQRLTPATCLQFLGNKSAAAWSSL